jgi:hypothetical protein
MDDQQALAILSALVNGTHPITGEIFADDSPYQAPDIIRALFAAQHALETRSPTLTVRAQPEPRATSPTNAGKPWSTDEDKQLLAAFDADKSLADIARLHGRTANGVRARLEKHGRLAPSAATRWPQSRENEDSGHYVRGNASGNLPAASRQS